MIYCDIRNPASAQTAREAPKTTAIYSAYTALQYNKLKTTVKTVLRSECKSNTLLTGKRRISQDYCAVFEKMSELFMHRLSRAVSSVQGRRQVHFPTEAALPGLKEKTDSLSDGTGIRFLRQRFFFGQGRQGARESFSICKSGIDLFPKLRYNW